MKPTAAAQSKGSLGEEIFSAFFLHQPVQDLNGSVEALLSLLMIGSGEKAKSAVGVGLGQVCPYIDSPFGHQVSADGDG